MYNTEWRDHVPHRDIQLLFDEIGVALDHHQYRDLISLADVYNIYVRQHQVSNDFNVFA